MTVVEALVWVLRQYDSNTLTQRVLCVSHGCIADRSMRRVTMWLYVIHVVCCDGVVVCRARTLLCIVLYSDSVFPMRFIRPISRWANVSLFSCRLQHHRITSCYSLVIKTKQSVAHLQAVRLCVLWVCWERKSEEPKERQKKTPTEIQFVSPIRCSFPSNFVSYRLKSLRVFTILLNQNRWKDFCNQQDWWLCGKFVYSAHLDWIYWKWLKFCLVENR